MNEKIKNAKRIVVKVGTSTLTYETGKLNIHRIEQLTRILCDLQNQGKEIILVSSGAIGVGLGRLGMKERPKETRYKQAIAAVGQCELMYLYDKLFSEYNNIVAQVLLTKNDVSVEKRRNNTQNTFATLLELGIIPIVNENDTVSTDEIEFGDNDTLSAIVAKLVEADLLVIFTDIDGLYTADPRNNPSATLIPVVENINADIIALAGGKGTNRGTGGMITKIKAGKLATEAGIDMIIMNGDNVTNLYNALNGESIGTLFSANKKGGV